MKIDPNDSANGRDITIRTVNQQGDLCHNEDIPGGGLTIRAELAARFVAAFHTNPELVRRNVEQANNNGHTAAQEMAICAIQLADALIAELNK